MSGKFAVLANMLDLLRRCTRDRIVIVSNYTQTLDLVGQVRRGGTGQQFQCRAWWGEGGLAMWQPASAHSLHCPAGMQCASQQSMAATALRPAPLHPALLQLCRDRAYPFVRLDGTTTIKKRNKLVSAVVVRVFYPKPYTPKTLYLKPP